MNAVIADASPINYLVLIGEIELLPLLFEQILIPSAVATELCRLSAPAVVRRWMQSPPAWLNERSVTLSSRVNHVRLDPGEAEAIQLALDIGAALILMDEVKGRTVAKQMKLSTDKAQLDRVDAIGQKIAAFANTTRVPIDKEHGFGNDKVYPFTWHFNVVDSKEVNAFSLPGGYVYEIGRAHV